MSSDQSNTTLTIAYSDRFSTLMLWWKAIFLVPIWGLLLLPFLGSLVSLGGSMALSTTFFVVLFLCLRYFIEDTLKRRLKIQDGKITHGFKQADLKDLLSVGTDYSDEEVVPKKIILTFKSGKSFNLKISRIDFTDYQKLLKHLSKNYPQVQIDPVLHLLVSNKEKARKILVDDGDRFIIEYNSQNLLKNLWRTFLDTAAPWLRFGPILAAVVTSPCWLGAIGGALTMAINWGDTRSEFYKASNELNSIASSQVSRIFSSVGDAGMSMLNFFSHPAIATISLLAIILLVLQALRISLRPNALVITKEGLKLTTSLAGNTIFSETLHWSDVERAALATADNGTSRINFSKKNGKTFSLNLSSISQQNRPRLTRALERFAPNCSIEATLSEAMLQRRDRSYTELWLQSLSTPPERNSLEPLKPGHELQHGQYRVLKRLAVGGQGTAYLCHDIANKCDVVLKETSVPAFADRQVKELALKRFEQEAKMLEAIDCPQIVELKDYFFEDHRGYLVLEHIEGENLRRHVEHNGPLKEEELRDILAQMLTILQYLHSRSIIHRDFTPDNLILTFSGRLKLIDFNVAQSTQVGTTGTIAGKHAYLPPEQFRGKATLQSDIYALGATMQYLLTGKDPEAISESSPLAGGLTVSQELDEIIRLCTKVDVGKRAQSVQAIAAMLNITLPEDESLVIKLDETHSSEGEPAAVGEKIQIKTKEVLEA
ncbi:MAG TPA: serine/threonine-protein kinase [Candidatus Obscuribacter sp.]|nr:serine/threonine-protein kinase [Candidatus Obscuribacter sp.]HNM48733.1 serine/threonine-protein kinase [Candidatus Obscuribacter sp.]